MAQQYTLDDDEAPSKGVYSVVAVVENCSPVDLQPLAEVIDPDALDALLTGGGKRDQVSFDYCGYEVTATPKGIRVEESTDG